MRKPRYRIVAGMRMPMGFPVGGLESVPELRLFDDDIFVVSYPKSGTTWLQYIVYLLIRHRTLGPDTSLNDVFPHLEEFGAGAFEALPRPRLIKTHLGFGMAPFSDAARYLVIVRNPFDCAVSFYHHTRGFPQHYDFADGSFAEFFECFIAGEVDFGGYFDHLLSWLGQVERDNVLLLTYEGLSGGTAATIHRVASFLGPDAEAGIATEAALDRVIAETSVVAMRLDQQRWSSRRPDWAQPFVREGRVGGWRSLFTPGQTRRLLAECERRLPGAGIGRLWPDLLAEAEAYAGSSPQDRLPGES